MGKLAATVYHSAMISASNWQWRYIPAGVIAGVLGFFVLAGTAATWIKLLSVVCLVLCVASFFRLEN